MPASSRTIDRSFVLMAIVITLLLLVPKLFQHAALHTGDMDTGNYSNLAWAIGHGEGFTGSVTGRHHLGEHFSPIMLLVAPVYLVWANGYVLMILQALATAGTIVGVLHFANTRFREGDSNDAVVAARVRMLGSGLLLILVLFYPPLLATW